MFRALEMQVELHPDSESASPTRAPFCLVANQAVRARKSKWGHTWEKAHLGEGICNTYNPKKIKYPLYIHIYV